MSERTASITHAEYEILNHLIENINLHELRASMCNDKVSASRFDKAADNVAELIENMMSRRTHKLPKTHCEYKGKGA
jgi:hypothetical protein